MPMPSSTLRTPPTSSAPSGTPSGRSPADELAPGLLASRAGAALALVHGLDPPDGDGVALLDKIGRQRLRVGHVLEPRVAVMEQSERRVDGEVGWGDVVEIVPGDGERDGDTRPDARA